MKNDDAAKYSIPNWSGDLFHKFLDHQVQLGRVLSMSIRGIHMLRGRHKAIEVLGKIDEKESELAHEERLKEAEREKELAQEEVENDFPLLHEQATVALWSSLEALVRSFVAAWLEHTPDATRVDAVQKLKVRLGDYEALDPQDRCLWIVDQLDQALSGPLKVGVKRFEALLEPFGLSGAFDVKESKLLFELSQMRHVIVHRSGIADPRFIAACPWLDYERGAKVKVSHEMWKSYETAVMNYVVELIQRVREHHGVPRYIPEGEIDE